MNIEESIVASILLEAGLTEVLGARHVKNFEAYKLNPIRLYDNNKKNAVRKQMRTIPNFHPHPIDKHEYWDWITERALEKQQELKDREQERLDKKQADREEVIRHAEEMWGTTPMISLKRIHQIDEEQKEKLAEEEVTSRVSKEIHSLPEFHFDGLDTDRVMILACVRQMLVICDKIGFLKFVPFREKEMAELIESTFLLDQKFNSVHIRETMSPKQWAIIYSDANNETLNSIMNKAIEANGDVRELWKDCVEILDEMATES